MLGNNHRLLRHLLLAAFVMLAAGALAALGGGSLGLKERKAPHKQQTRQPRYVFTEGVLRADGFGSWSLDDGTRLQVSSDVVWIDEAYAGKEGYPAGGRLAFLMGQRLGGVFVVRQAILRPVQRQFSITTGAAESIAGEVIPDEPH